MVSVVLYFAEHANSLEDCVWVTLHLGDDLGRLALPMLTLLFREVPEHGPYQVLTISNRLIVGTREGFVYQMLVLLRP